MAAICTHVSKVTRRVVWGSIYRIIFCMYGKEGNSYGQEAITTGSIAVICPFSWIPPSRPLHLSKAHELRMEQVRMNSPIEVMQISNLLDLCDIDPSVL